MKKLYDQLLEQGYTGSYTTVCRFIKQLKTESSSLSQAFVPLQFDAGDALQFDWSHEVVVLGGIAQKIKVAHFRLAYRRQPFVIAYPRETQEMLIDAFTQALKFYQVVPLRVLIDNPKTMALSIGKGKARDFHPRFMALMNHYVIEPVACTPAAGWEKGQIENQVRSALRPLGRPFDGYAEKLIQVSSTCLVSYDSNRYSVPCSYARQRISLRAYVNRIVLIADRNIIAMHQRSSQKNNHIFDPWHKSRRHYVMARPLLNGSCLHP